MGDFDDLSDEEFWAMACTPFDLEETGFVLTQWSVWKVQTKDHLTEWHLVGYDGDTGEERVSGALKRFDTEFGQGVTRSGEEYQLMGPPDYWDNGERIWQAWEKADQYACQKNVTSEIWGPASQEYEVINPLHIPDT